MDRKYAMGLGTGVILGALLLQLMFIGQNPSTDSSESGLPSNWMDLAAEQGFVVYSADQINLGSSAADPLSVNKETTVAEKDKASGGKMQAATVEIRNGMKSAEVAQMLEMAGVIESSADLLKELETMGLSKKIQIGVYTFTLPSTVEEVAEAITSRN